MKSSSTLYISNGNTDNTAKVARDRRVPLKELRGPGSTVVESFGQSYRTRLRALSSSTKQIKRGLHLPSLNQ